MGLFRSVLHPAHKDEKGKGPADVEQAARPLEPCPSTSPPRSSSSAQSRHTATRTPPATTQQNTPPRFQLNPDGTHTHHIKCANTHRLQNSLQGLAAGLLPSRVLRLPLLGEKASPESIQREREAINAELKRTSDEYLSQKWGTCQEIIGKGAFGVVRVVHKLDPSSKDEKRLYAVKEFRKKSSETTKHYVKRLTAEFCIASSLHHPNVIQTLDLLPLNETSPVYCEVMEYCDGGDLFNVICENASNGLQAAEANCFFKQLVSGVEYLHRMGIAHRDLKPENLLLTTDGCVKISDFGGAECFRPVFEQQQPLSEIYFSKGVCGSEPYIAPEEFIQSEYDPRPVDVWSCGVIYMAMRTGNHLWQIARKGEDENYDRYLKFRRLVEEERENTRRERMNQAGRDASIQKARESVRRRAKESGLDILEGLEFAAKKLIYRMLDPNPQKRITISHIVANEWFRTIVCCHYSSPDDPSTTKSSSSQPP